MGYEYYGNGYEYYGDYLRVALNKCLIDSEISERSVRLMITVNIGKRGWIYEAEWDFGVKYVCFWLVNLLGVIF